MQINEGADATGFNEMNYRDLKYERRLRNINSLTAAKTCLSPSRNNLVLNDQR
jgi:hypothetical protein